MAIPICTVLPYCVISPTIRYNAGRNYKINTHLVQVLINLLHGNKFSPWEDFFVSPFSSDAISNYVRVHVRISVQVLVEAHAVEQ